MSKGYVYIMTSAIEGLIKIGKSKDWNRRCKDELEANGYKNINALKTYYVAECEDYDEIENIMHDIFRESRVSNIEAFAVDKDRAKRVLSRMGTQVYPEIEVKSALSSANNNVVAAKNSGSDLCITRENFWKMINDELERQGQKRYTNVEGYARNYVNMGGGSLGGCNISLLEKDTIVSVTFYCSEEIYNKLAANINKIKVDFNEEITAQSYVKKTGLKAFYFQCKLDDIDIKKPTQQQIRRIIKIVDNYRTKLQNYV